MTDRRSTERLADGPRTLGRLMPKSRAVYSKALDLIGGKVPVTEEDVARLRAVYEAMRSGDVMPLAELMDEKIRWIGSDRFGDPPPECNGREEASAVLKRAVKRMPAGDIESVAIAGDRILAVAYWHEDQGPPGVERVYNLLTMRDGRIVKMEDFFDRSAAERAFSGTESGQA